MKRRLRDWAEEHVDWIPLAVAIVWMAMWLALFSALT